jgi:hypothetical protein
MKCKTPDCKRPADTDSNLCKKCSQELKDVRRDRKRIRK